MAQIFATVTSGLPDTKMLGYWFETVAIDTRYGNQVHEEGRTPA